MDGIGASEVRQRVHQAQQRYRMPVDAREILLIRHGASVGATIDAMEIGGLSVSDPQLCEKGIAQAKALAQYLARAPVDAIFVTPLRRTRDTAAPLAAARAIEPVVVAELREVHLGDWEHDFYDRAAAGHPLVARLFAEENWDVIPRAETPADLAVRVRAGIDAIVAAIPAGTVAAAFTHAGVIAELCRQATGSRPFAFMAPENSSISRLVVFADGRWKLRSFNDTAHLDY